jgi:hemerythrin
MYDWTDQYHINVKEIDKQHEVLFSIINEIVEMLRNETYDFNRLYEIMVKLDDYVVEHFRFEEQLMLIESYPQMEEHVREHNQFRYDMSKFNIVDVKQPKEFLEGGLEYLMKWLSNHIMGTDKKLGEFIYTTKLI